MELAFECTYDVPVNWKVYVENGLEGYHVPVVHDLLNDFVDTRSARHFLEEHSSYSHALIKASYRELMPPAPPHLGPEETACSRFGLVFPNLIPVVTPVDFSYLRIDPVACDRIRLVGRSFDLGGAYAGEFRAFRREAFDRTNQQVFAVVIRVQRGLAARGFEGGVYAAFLECRIGHFERLVSRALTYGARVAVPPLAEAEPITYERVTGARGTAVA
jgi:choline monooxygenase